MLVTRQGIYAHNDPAGAYPKNLVFEYLVLFLDKVTAQAKTKPQYVNSAPPPQGLG